MLVSCTKTFPVPFFSYGELEATINCSMLNEFMGPDTHQTGAAERAELSAFRQSSLNEE